MSIEPAKIRTRQRIALWGSILLLAALSAAQLCFYLSGYEFDADLYAPGPLPVVTAILWIAAAVGAFVLSVFLPGKEPCKEFRIPPTPFNDFACLLCSASLVGTAAFPLLWKNIGSDPLGNLLASSASSDSTARTMLLLTLVLAIPAAIYFIVRFAYRKSSAPCACAVLLWTAFSALRIYFDMRYLLMSPRRILHLVALTSVILFLIAELRLARGIATHRFYAVCASITLVLAGCDAVTNLILVAMGWVQPGSELFTYCFLFSIALYAISRLAALCKDTAPTPKIAAPSSAESDPVSIPVASLTEESDTAAVEETIESETQE